MYCPTYAQFGETVEFIVTSDEKLDPFKQNAYVMFGNNRYDIVLRYDENRNEYIGLFNTNAFVDESCTVFVELYDDVGNIGTINTKIVIFSNKELSIDYDVHTRMIHIKQQQKRVEFEMDKMFVEHNTNIQHIDFKTDKMVINTNVTVERNCD